MKALFVIYTKFRIYFEKKMNLTVTAPIYHTLLNIYNIFLIVRNTNLYVLMIDLASLNKTFRHEDTVYKLVNEVILKS